MNAPQIARHLAACATLAASLSACSSTHLAATWREPSASPTRFSHTLVAFVTTDEALRRTVEDKLAGTFPGGTPSYRVIATPSATDTTAVRRQLADLGFDGAVVMRVVDVDTRVNVTPGAYWYATPYRFGSYWASGWAYPYDPGYAYVADRVVTIETQVYTLRDDRIVWAARSETTNPSSVRKLTDSVIKHVTKAMRNDGFLAGLAQPLSVTAGGA